MSNCWWTWLGEGLRWFGSEGCLPATTNVCEGFVSLVLSLFGQKAFNYSKIGASRIVMKTIHTVERALFLWVPSSK